jgi:hypothetical protein
MWQTKSPKIATALAVAYTFVQAGACVTCTCTPANPRAVPTATWAPPPSIVTPPAASLLGARAAPPMQGTVIINLILGVVLTSLEKVGPGREGGGRGGGEGVFPPLVGSAWAAARRACWGRPALRAPPFAPSACAGHAA